MIVVGVLLKNLNKGVWTWLVWGQVKLGNFCLDTQRPLFSRRLLRWRPGTGTLDVEDWENPGVTVTLRLPDASASPIEAAEAAFARARKSARGQQTVADLLRRTEDQLSRLREAQLQLSLLEGAQDRDAILEILVCGRLGFGGLHWYPDYC